MLSNSYGTCGPSDDPLKALAVPRPIDRMSIVDATDTVVFCRSAYSLGRATTVKLGLAIPGGPAEGRIFRDEPGAGGVNAPTLKKARGIQRIGFNETMEFNRNGQR